MDNQFFQEQREQSIIKARFDMLSRPLDDLQGMLLREYSGQTIDFMTLYEVHSVDKPYIKKNYKDVLRSLYEAQKITATNPKGNPADLITETKRRLFAA